jgi:hypothetical protein
MKKYLIDEQEVSQTMYLYGIEDVPEIPQDIIDRRIAVLEANLSKVLDHSFYTRDGRRANAILKAIKFWTQLGNEGDNE